MGGLLQAAVVVMVATAFLHGLTESRAVDDTRLDTEDVGRNRRTADQRKGWLKDATAISLFRVLDHNNNGLLTLLQNSQGGQITNVNLGTYPVSTEANRTASNIPYNTDDYQQGQGDILSRVKSFQFLLVKAADCLRNVAGSGYTGPLDKASSVNTSLSVYFSYVTELCNNSCTSDQGKDCAEAWRDCDKGMDAYVTNKSDWCQFFNEGEDPGQTAPNTYGEQMSIISTYLQIFLCRLKSMDPMDCTVN